MSKLLGIKQLCEFWQAIKSALNGKVDKETGKGLSTNDYTTAEKNKLAGIASGAEVNVQSDWNVTDTSSDAFIKNKPTIPTKTSQLTNDSDFVSDANYVHTDNNYTTAEKTKLNGIEAGAEKNRTYTDFTGKPTGNQTPGFGDTFTLQQIKQSTTGQVSGTDHTVTIPDTEATTTTAGLMSAADKTKLNGIASGAEVNVQSNWNQSDTTADDYIKNKPSIPTKTSDLTNDSDFVSDANYVHTDNNFTTAEKTKLNGIEAGAEVNRTYTAVTGKPTANQTPAFGGTATVSQIKQSATGQITATDRTITIPDTTATTSAAGLMSAADKTKLNGIATGAEVNVQSDWSQTTTTADDYIKNKPSVYTKTEADNRYVNIAGDTMTGNLTVNCSTAAIYVRGTISGRVDATAVSANTRIAGLHFRDSNNDIVGYTEVVKSTSNASRMSFVVRKTLADGSSYVNHGFYLVLSNSSTPTVEFTTGASRDAFATGLNVVKKAGDTMTGALTVSRSGNNAPKIRAKNESITLGVNPSEAIYNNEIDIRDSADNLYAIYRTYQTTDGTVYAGIYVRNKASSSGDYTGTNALYIGVKKDGTRVVSVSDSAAWRSALSVYSKTESDDRYVNVAGDTMTGKLTLNAGLAIKSGSGQTSPPFFLCLNESYADGGNVGYVTKANMVSAIGAAAASHNHSASNITSGSLAKARGGTGTTYGLAWQSIASSTGTTKVTFSSVSGYSEVLVSAKFANLDNTGISKFFTTVIPTQCLSNNILEVWVGGGRGNSSNGYANTGARAVCYVTLTYIQGVASNDAGTDRTSATQWSIFAR